MWWVVWWALVTAAGACGIVSSVNGVRFGRRVAAEVRAFPPLGNPPPIAPQKVVGLPAPVQRYLARAIPPGRSFIRRARLRHGGLFRPSLNGSWLPISGEQYFSADPPGFIWWGRVRVAPGVWIDARDRSINGAGNMFVTLESTVTVANSSAPELDQAALLRLLGELAWVPTVFLDERYVTWSAVDDRHARASLRVKGGAVSADFEFGADDLPATFSAQRYRDLGDGTSALTPFVGRVSDFRPVDGVLVPYRVTGAWVVDGRSVEYVNFEVQQLEFDRVESW